MRTALLAMLLGALALVGGCADSPEDAFYKKCGSASDCPDGWICPSPSEQGMGAIGNVCSPKCTTDKDCRDISGRTDVFCELHVCAIECVHATDCPTEQPVCRGDNASCTGQPVPRPLFCSTADFSCL